MFRRLSPAGSERWLPWTAWNASTNRLRPTPRPLSKHATHANNSMVDGGMDTYECWEWGNALGGGMHAIMGDENIVQRSAMVGGAAETMVKEPKSWLILVTEDDGVCLASFYVGIM